MLMVLVMPAGASSAIPSSLSPKRELRGLWLATVWGIDWPSVQGVGMDVRTKQQRDLSLILDGCVEANLNTVFFQVRGMADVMYDSDIEPWSAAVSGKRGVNPGWNPLAWVVAECHARGLECYAWVNPFRWSSGSDYDTTSDRDYKRRGWLLSHGRYTVLNPGMEDVRQHVVALCREIVEDYDVDGLVFDDYFYPNRITESCEAPDYALYIREAPWMKFGDWRRACVHKTIADVSGMIRDVKPHVRFGVSPAGVAGKVDTSAGKWGVESMGVKASDWQYSEIYSDPLGLMYQGTIDFVSPQIYWPTTHPTAPYDELADWWSESANMLDTHMYASVTLERINSGSLAGHREELVKQIERNRVSSRDGNPGTVIYSAKFLPKVSEVLALGVFAWRSLTPCCREYVSEIPMVSGVKLRNGVLSWKCEPDVRRFTVYAVPEEVSMDEAMAIDGDGIDSAYLLGVTYEPRMEVGREPGFRYAVCVYTGRSSEGAPVWLK